MSVVGDILLPSKALKDVRILVVDNDRDSSDLYDYLLASYGAKTTKLASIKDAVSMLDKYLPSLVICEVRFLGESVLPLIQKVRWLADSKEISIPIIGTSTCSSVGLFLEIQVKLEAYLLKPIDLNELIYQAHNLTLGASLFCSLPCGEKAMPQIPLPRSLLNTPIF
jgi:DNA-binding response OmpR family regulator